MLSGEIYDANNDSELIEERDNCKDKCFDFNATRPSNKEKIFLFLHKLFALFALTVGFFSRAVAFILAFNMLIAAKFHWSDDFATLSLPLLFLGIYCVLIPLGGGKYSVDSLLFNRSIKVK